MKILSGCLICSLTDLKKKQKKNESSEDTSCGNVSSDEYENELVEVDDISQFGFLEAP